MHQRPEAVENRTKERNESGFNRIITYVSNPTITIHPAAKEMATGTAVVIFPGGGYRKITIDREGHDIARRLNAAGIYAFVVKYRTCPDEFENPGYIPPAPILKAIISDGQRAVRIVRSRAAQWNINPGRIGVMGFSAGGHLAISVATHYQAANPRATDPLGRVSSRPDFVGAIYPVAPTSIQTDVTADTPPMFLVNAADDKTTPVERCIEIFMTLQKAHVPSELHVYTYGGHGFGLGVRGGSVTSWPERFIDWLGQTKLMDGNTKPRN